MLAAAVTGPEDRTFAWQRYLLRAWHRGRRAAPLTVVPYESLLPRALDEVRERLHIKPASV